MEQDTYQSSSPVIEPSEGRSKNTGLIIGMVICIILAVGGIGFGVYSMLSKNNSDNSGDGGEQAQNTSQDEETDSLGTYETRDLLNKTFRLLGTRNGFSTDDYYNKDSNTFLVYKDYMPVDEIISNQLNDNLKVYATLETTSQDKDKRCNYQWTEGVKPDIDTALGAKGTNIQFSSTDIKCISYDKANGDYNDLWGENMPKINSFTNDDSFYGDYAYGSNLDAYYYQIIGGRGGTSSRYAIGQVSQIEGNGDEAYVDIHAGTVEVGGGQPVDIYSDIEKTNLYKSIEQDGASLDNLGLTENDYNSFQTYRFVFTKNSDGIYTFSKVEKQ